MLILKVLETNKLNVPMYYSIYYVQKGLKSHYILTLQSKNKNNAFIEE